MYQLLETICCKDGKFLNLPLHEQRMTRSGDELFPMHAPYNLPKLLNNTEPPSTGLAKCRVLYRNTIEEISLSVYTPKLLRTFALVTADTLHYQHKFANRSALNMLKQSSTADEILIVQQGLLTDASFANLVFWDGSSWVTPAQPLLHGTQRQLLLQHGVIAERNIPVESLSEYHSFKLINAMLSWDEAPVYPIQTIYNLPALSAKARL